MFRSLALWWSQHYNRPLKDPLLQEYTLEDLIYERYIVMEKGIYDKELDDADADRIEEEKLQEDDDWADQMEAMVASEEKTKAEPPPKKEEPYDPLKDPENIKWMEKEIEASKSFFGDDFGEDVSISFDDESE